jgi:hypothetical protein
MSGRGAHPLLVLMLALLLQAAAPGPEAIALGERLARSGTLASLIPEITARDTEQLVAAHPELDVADVTALRRIAAETAERGAGQLYAAMGRAYAERLSKADLKRLVAYAEGDLSRRYREAGKGAVVAATAQMQGMDFKKDVAAAFCAKTGKLCPKP